MNKDLFQNFPLLLAYVICIVCLVQLFIIFFIERKDILKGLKGKDLIWQFVELTGLTWLILFPCTVISSLLGIQVDRQLWIALETVYFMNLGSRFGQKWLDNKKEENEK